uniref:(78-11) Lincomycin production genes n=1 Tax=Streptomyces lincolnensis TaxID=1915 RepID=Q54382_STRLN|nr:unnamed protein product [Streptomyces lincolnensis]
MRDSPKDPASIVGVLSAFIRTHCGRATSDRQGLRDAVAVTAAATAVAERRPHRDDEELVNWLGCRLTDIAVEGAYLSFSDLSGVTMCHTALYTGDHFRPPRSPETVLDGVGFDGVNFADSVLAGVDLTKSHPPKRPNVVVFLSDIEFPQCDLTRTNFSPARRVSHIDFRHADLTDANLSHTEVAPESRDPFFVGRTSFEGATMANTNLDGADLREAHGLTVDQLITAHFTPATKLPAHLASPDHHPLGDHKAMGTELPMTRSARLVHMVRLQALLRPL